MPAPDWNWPVRMRWPSLSDVTKERTLKRPIGRVCAGAVVVHLLVAAAAEEHDLTVVHYDADFDLIASVTGQRCQWIIRAGSTD